MDRGKTRNGDAQLFAGRQWRSWQGTQDFLLSDKACIACLVAFVDQILQKLFVGGSVRKIPAPPDAQRLVESGTLVFNLNPLMLAWVPTALLAVAALLLIWRAR